MRKSKILFTVSKKGGVGATSVAMGIAVALSKSGEKVLLLELKREANSAVLYLGMQDEFLFSFSDYLSGTEMEKVFKNSEACPNLYCCLSPDKNTSFTGAKRKLEELSEAFHFDYLIIDADIEDEAGMDFLYSLGHKETGIVVTTQNPVSLLKAEKAAELIKAHERETLLVINRFDLSDLSSYHEGRQSVLSIIDTTHTKLLGIIGESYAEMRRSEEGTFLKTEDITDTLFQNIAKRLQGEDIPLFEGMKDAKKIRKKIQ